MEIESKVIYYRYSQMQLQKVYAGFKKRVQVKKYKMSPEININSPKLSQSSNTNDS